MDVAQTEQSFNWDGAYFVYREEQCTERMIKDTFVIRVYANNLNLEFGTSTDLTGT